MRFDQIVRRDLRTHSWDYALAGMMVAVAVIALATRIDVQDADTHLFRSDTWLVWTLTIAVCVTLVGRRRWPLWALAISLILVLPIEFSRQRDTVAFFALVIVLYSVAAYLPLRVALRGVALMVAFYVVLFMVGTIVLTAVPLLGTVFLSAAFASGLAMQRSRTREHRESEIAVERAAAAIETAEVEAADERLRMAQELHDVVAHSLSVIAVQAGIGAHLMDRRPAEAAHSLDAIRSACESTGIELDRLVEILRNGRVNDSTAAPSLAMIATLVGQIRSTDVVVTLNIEGELATVPAGVSLAAYRIVQEALTNIVRHAGSPVAATVTIQATDDHIGLTVDDDGRGVTAHESGTGGGGNGLVGMRERAHMYGGDVHAGPRPGGGFRVRATLGTLAESGSTMATPQVTTFALDPGRVSDRRRLSPSTWDAALAALMGVLAVIEVMVAHPRAGGPHFTPNDAWATAFRLGCIATLAFRRRYPTVAYAVAWVLGLALIVRDYRFDLVTLVLLIALYSVAAHAPPRRVAAALVGTFVGIVIVAWSKPPDLNAAGAVWASVFFVASAITGHVARHDRERRTRELNERQNDASARTRHARLVLANERLRIADELGTVLTRSIDTIARHAETGSRLIDSDSDIDSDTDTERHTDSDADATRDALQTISTISRDALNDLRRLLKHLRSTSEPMSYAPIPSTAETVGIDTVVALP